MSFVIRNPQKEGFKYVKDLPGFFPRKETSEEFCVKTAKQSSNASQVTALIGILDCIKRISSCSKLMYGGLMKDTNVLNGLIGRISKKCKSFESSIVKGRSADLKRRNLGFGKMKQKKRSASKMKYEQDSGFFTSSTLPESYKEQLKSCEDIPCFQILDSDPLNETSCEKKGVNSYRQLYSNPFGIYSTWLKKQKSRTERKTAFLKKMKRKEKAGTFERKESIQRSVQKVKSKWKDYYFPGRKIAVQNSKTRKRKVVQLEQEADEETDKSFLQVIDENDSEVTVISESDDKDCNVEESDSDGEEVDSDSEDETMSPTPVASYHLGNNVAAAPDLPERRSLFDEIRNFKKKATLRKAHSISAVPVAHHGINNQVRNRIDNPINIGEILINQMAFINQYRNELDIDEAGGWDEEGIDDNEW